MSRATEKFESMVFNETVMRDKLPKETYKKCRQLSARKLGISSNSSNIF